MQVYPLEGIQINWAWSGLGRVGGRSGRPAWIQTLVHLVYTAYVKKLFYKENFHPKDIMSLYSTLTLQWPEIF